MMTLLASIFPRSSSWLALLLVLSIWSCGQSLSKVSDKLLKKKVTHLISLKPSGAKYDKALEWGIPVVSAGSPLKLSAHEFICPEWLFVSIMEGRAMACGDYPSFFTDSVLHTVEPVAVADGMP